jgi:hypothetical protein
VGITKLKIRNQKDFYAGLIFILFGMIAMLEARHYSMGTAARMGPSDVGRSYSCRSRAFDPNPSAVWCYFGRYGRVTRGEEKDEGDTEAPV